MMFLPEFFDSQLETIAKNYIVHPDQIEEDRFLVGFAPVRVTIGRDFAEGSIG
jgi:hypothetical protein